MSTPPQLGQHKSIVRPDVSDGVEVVPPLPPQIERRQTIVRRGHRRKHRHEDGLAPSAAELAEALFATTQALKSTGRLCTEEANPALRSISFPRARVLMVMDDVQEGRIRTPGRSARGRGRRRVMDDAKQARVRMSDLAGALGVTARNITTIVDGLEREGLIARVPDHTDRRAILLELTSKGQEHIAEVHALQCSIAERFFASLDAMERAELMRLLAKIGEAAGVAGC